MLRRQIFRRFPASPFAVAASFSLIRKSQLVTALQQTAPSAALLTGFRCYHATPVRHQGQPVVRQALASDSEATLFAKAGHSLFVLASIAPPNATLAAGGGEEVLALFCPTTQNIFIGNSMHLNEAAAFFLSNTDPEKFASGIVFPADASPSLAAFLANLKRLVEQQPKRRLVVGPDAWSIVYSSFKAQQEHVRTIELPTGFEHASVLMTNKRFAPLNVPSLTMPGKVSGPSLPETTGTSKAALTEAYLIERNSAARRALVVWDTLLGVHRRFGMVGSKKAINALDLVIRRAVKAVNIFVVDLDNRLGRGSVTEGITMVATIYNAQVGTNTVHQIRNLSEESVKLNILTTLLYGEGTSSITVLVPTPRTKETQLTTFARICKPKCPFFIVPASQVAQYFQQPEAAFNFTDVQDPKTLFQRTIGSCFPGAPKKDEDENGLKVRKVLTFIGHKLFDQRLGNTARAFASGVLKMPSPTAAQDDFDAFQERATLTPAAATSTFLNKVVRDGDAVGQLEDWFARIYKNPDRLKREQAALDAVHKYLVVDLETTTVKRYKRIANPFTKENWIVLSGALDYKGQMFMPKSYFEKDVAQRYDDAALCAANTNVEGSSAASLFLPPLDDYDVIVGHNLKFDLLHLWRDAEVRRFLQRGGKIWDTMYAEYLLTGHQVKLGRGAGLEDVAKSYGGRIPKLDLVKQAWAQGKATYDIPYATLREYLEGDLKNTELIFLKHRPRALEQRQAIIINARMDSLLATTEMEYNGLKIDVPLAIKQSNELVGTAVRKKQVLETSIPSEVPEKLKKFFNWASNQMLIAYFFGGKVKINTGNRASKVITGEKIERHLIFGKPEHYPLETFPNGVFLASQHNPSAPGDCTVVTTSGDAEKGTRVFVCCIDNYMKVSGFRKSSTLADSVSKRVVGVSRLGDRSAKTEVDAVANLLPHRVVFLYAAFTIDPASDRLSSVTMHNPLTNASVTFQANSPDFAEVMEAYWKRTAREHTLALVPPHDAPADPSMSPTAFIDGQVIVIARDAPFTFRRALESASSDMAAMLARRCSPSAASLTALQSENPSPLDECFSVSFADATSTMLYYRHAYTGHEWSIPDCKRPPVLLPEFLPATTSKRKTATTSLIPSIHAETSLTEEAWCQKYKAMFNHIATYTFLDDADQVLEAKKARKNAPPPKPDEALPLLLRRRPLVKAAWEKSMTPDLQARLSTMILLGRPIGTTHDPFVEVSEFEETVEIPLKGKLAQCGISDNEAEVIMKKFRSPITRQLQVGDDSLTYFAKTHKDKVASTIMDLRADEKLIGTYYEHTEGGTGMVSLTHSIDSCIHHELVHNKTNTGRLASANPNCQNIPKEDKSPLREMFVSRFQPNGVCIEVDYSQLEVITLAALSKDQQMIDDLIKNVDFHCKRVTMIRPDLSYDEVVQRAKKNKEPEFVKLRQQAKIFSFQRQYGAGVTMLSESTGLSPDTIRKLIEAEREIYRGCDVFTNMVTISANKYDASLQDGSRNIRGHQFYKGMFPVITGSRYVFTESDVPEAIMRDKPESSKSTNFSPTHLKNYPVQGFAGEIVQIMLGKLWRHFVQCNNYNGKALLTNTVHDCVWVDTTEEIYKQVAADVERILSGAKEELNRLWPEMQTTVSFGVDVVAGENMCHLRPIPKDKK